MTEVEFDNLVEVHGKDILRYCRITAGSTEGDELYQDTLLRLWEQHEKLDSEGNIKSYALSIAVRLWKNEKRKYARRRRLAPSFSYEEGVEHGDFTSLAAARGSEGQSFVSQGSAEEILNPEHRTIEEETNLEIRRAVRRLPEKYRQPVILYYSADLKTKEISECLRISENTVKTRLRKARELLKKELEGKIYG